MSKTRTQLFWSVAFLLGSIAIWFKVAPVEHPPAPEPVPVVQSQAAHSSLQVEGTWEQYAVENNRRYFMARLQIQADCTSYLASPLELSANTYPKHAYRSFHHSENDGVWSFREDWDHGNIGEFVLVRQPNGEYRGIAKSLQDGTEFETIFVRVGD